MERKQSAIRWILLISSVFFLLSVTIPHHHHEGGSICFVSLFSDEAEHQDCTACGDECQDCSHHHPIHNCDDCAVTVSNPTFHDHLQHLDMTPDLVPLLVLADYLYPNELPSFDNLFAHRCVSYIESLHSVWIKQAFGLRAPPCF